MEYLYIVLLFLFLGKLLSLIIADKKDETSKKAKAEKKQENKQTTAKTTKKEKKKEATPVSHLIKLKEVGRFTKLFMSDKERYGMAGEEYVADLLEPYLAKDDYLFVNANLEVNGQKGECDLIFVGKKGIKVIEIKSHVGDITGDFDDETWIQEKESYTETFIKDIRNPVKQLNREIYILKNYLQQFQIRKWIEGYVYFVNGNGPSNCEQVLNSEEELITAIKTSNEDMLDRNDILNIKYALEKLKK